MGEQVKIKDNIEIIESLKAYSVKPLTLGRIRYAIYAGYSRVDQIDLEGQIANSDVLQPGSTTDVGLRFQDTHPS